MAEPENKIAKINPNEVERLIEKFQQDKLAQNCQGRLWPVKRPHHLVQFTGNPTITATHYQQDVLKCADCEKEYEAPLPAGVKPQRWDETADTAMVIQKVALATPFYRTAEMQRSCGIPLPASVQWERCKAVAEALRPVYCRYRWETACRAIGAVSTRESFASAWPTRGGSFMNCERSIPAPAGMS
jgi:hypothetical protein